MRKSETVFRTMRNAICLLTACLGLAASATGVRMAHEIVLKSGWNAFYLPVAPGVSADEFFADWPTDRVGCYDQSGYLRTEQFTVSAEDSTQGAVAPRMLLWVRDEPGRSSLVAVPGNAVYLVNVTNRTGFAKTVYGEPTALRTVWHVTSGNDHPLNYLGISTDGTAAQVSGESYLLGLDTDWTSRYTVGGRPTLTAPNLTALGRDPSVANGSAVAMDAAKTGDWSGPLFVSPVNGFDLGTNGTMGVLTVRNDSGTNRTVRVAFAYDQAPTGVLQLPKLMSLDPAREGAWNTNFNESAYECELKAGERLELRLAVDREKELLGPAGTEYGGIIRVTDVSPENCSHFRTAVPFSVTADGGEFRRTKWPRGLWIADVTLDKVSQILPEELHRFADVVMTNSYLEVDESVEPPVTNEVTEVVTNRVEIPATTPVKAGAAMKLRLLVHVDYNGALNLMQRARAGGRRLSAAVLPTDLSVISGRGTFGGTATFDWSVAETSRVSPFRHARHPDHDGLRADFKAAAPSGDDFNNYNSTVKPELFSVANEVSFMWDATTGAGWSPEETLSGTCVWTLTGLRREGGIETTGTFTMRRVSALGLDELKEDF